MIKHLLTLLSGLAVMAMVACAPPAAMIQKNPPAAVSAIKPEPGKAALVISRTTNFGGAIEFRTYLDKVYIGSTRGKCYFAKTNIDSGTRFVSSFGENGVAVKVNFEPNKVYYLQHNVSMGVWKARVVMEALNAKRLDSGDLSGCTYYEYDPAKNETKDLTEEEFKDVIQGASTLIVNADGSSELVSEKTK